MSRGKHYAAISAAAVTGFLISAGAHSPSLSEFKMTLTALFGGAATAYGLWKVIGETVFKNLESLAGTRGERIDELEKLLQREREERQSAERRMREDFETRCDNLQRELDDFRRRYHDKVAETIELSQQLAAAAGSGR